MSIISPPNQDEYPEYANMYLKWIPRDGAVLAHLKENFEKVRDLVSSLTEEQLLSKYQEKKWSIKQVLVHIVDDERIYAYRALRFARNDTTAIPGFEQDLYSEYSEADNRDINSIMREYQHVRESTIALFESFSESALLRKGIANDVSVSVRALAYHIAGHEMHHYNILLDKYLS